MHFILIIKVNEFTISQICLIKYCTFLGQVHCPSSRVSQHCIHAIGRWSGWTSVQFHPDHATRRQQN